MPCSFPTSALPDPLRDAPSSATTSTALLYVPCALMATRTRTNPLSSVRTDCEPPLTTPGPLVRTVIGREPRVPGGLLDLIRLPTFVLRRPQRLDALPDVAAALSELER